MANELQIGLAMIAKDKADIIARALDSTKGVFDKYYLQDTGSTDDTVKVFRDWCQKYDKPYKISERRLEKDYAFVEVHGKKTLGDFGLARNDSFELARGEMDYLFWIDTDDIIHHPENIRPIFERMNEQKIPMLLAQYDYAKRQQGISAMTQLRERFIDLRLPGKWEDRVHETYTIEGMTQQPSKVEEVWVEHHRDINQVNETGRRNNLIMTAQLEEEGLENFSDKMLRNLAFDHWEYKEWEKAIYYYELLAERVPVDSHMALEFDIAERLAKAYQGMGDYKTAMKHAFECIRITPDLAVGYLICAELYADVGNWKQVDYYAGKVLELGIPKVVGAINEAEYEITPLKLKAQAALSLNELDNALQIMQQIAQKMPGDGANKQNITNVEKLKEANEAILGIASIMQFYRRHNRIDWYDRILKVIPPELKGEDTVRKLIKEIRYDLERKTKKFKLEGSKTIVIYAGQHYEAWDGNSDREKGIGGSEGMCIQISRELAKLGNKVFIYNEAGESDGKVFEGVTYLHHSKWSPEVKSDIFISLRRPDVMLQMITAKKQYLWLHDTHYGQQELVSFLMPNKVFALSEAHKQVLMDSHQLTDASIFYLTRNGLNRDALEYADKNAGERDPYKLIYASSYDRGLNHVINMWPKIKEAVPEATLDIYYGWTGFDKMMEQRLKVGDPYGRYQQELKTSILEGIAKNDGIRELGRISQNELYTRFKEASIWFYPTEFYEISCINAMTAQAMGAIPVCTPHAALKETVNAEYGFKAPLETITDVAIYALQNPLEMEERRKGMIEWSRKEYDMASLAKEWDEFLNND